jgi:hypothetical protein
LLYAVKCSYLPQSLIVGDPEDLEDSEHSEYSPGTSPLGESDDGDLTLPSLLFPTHQYFTPTQFTPDLLDSRQLSSCPLSFTCHTKAPYGPQLIPTCNIARDIAYDVGSCPDDLPNVVLHASQPFFSVDPLYTTQRPHRGVMNLPAFTLPLPDPL